MAASSSRTSKSAHRGINGTYLGASHRYVGLATPNFNVKEEGYAVDTRRVSKPLHSRAMIISPHEDIGIRGPRVSHRENWPTHRPEEYKGGGVYIWPQIESLETKFVLEPKISEAKRNIRMEVESLNTFINNALDLDKNEVEIVSETKEKFKGTDQMTILKIINQIKEKRFDQNDIPQELIHEIEQWDNID